MSKWLSSLLLPRCAMSNGTPQSPCRVSMLMKVIQLLPKFGSAFILMDGVPGVHAKIRDIPNHQKYCQMADVAMQLAGLRFPKIGRIYHFDRRFHRRFFCEAWWDGIWAVFYRRRILRLSCRKWRKRTLFQNIRGTRPQDTKDSGQICKSFVSYSSDSVFTCQRGFFRNYSRRLRGSQYSIRSRRLNDRRCRLGTFTNCSCLLSCDYPVMLAVRWPYVDRHSPVVFKTIPECQELFHEGVRLVEQKYNSVLFEGKLMSDIVGSPPAIISQILENLNADIGYRRYDGWKVFEFLYGEADFDAARIEFEKLADIRWCYIVDISSRHVSHMTLSIYFSLPPKFGSFHTHDSFETMLCYRCHFQRRVSISCAWSSEAATPLGPSESRSRHCTAKRRQNDISWRFPVTASVPLPITDSNHINGSYLQYFWFPIGFDHWSSGGDWDDPPDNWDDSSDDLYFEDSVTPFIAEWIPDRASWDPDLDAAAYFEESLMEELVEAGLLIPKFKNLSMSGSTFRGNHHYNYVDNHTSLE